MSFSLDNSTTSNNLEKSQNMVVPDHVAIIMDGNGRWAKEKGLDRIEGHRRGAYSVRKIVEESRRIGIRYLTLFSFSTENWNRSSSEVSALMSLFVEYLGSEKEQLLANGIRLRVIGDRKRLPASVLTKMSEVELETASNKDLDLILAISYSGREEILNAVREISESVNSGLISIESIDHNLFESKLWTAGIPEPDLLIRTSGELRISNFLLWQLAYSEIVVSNKYWPDFSESDFSLCLEEYSKRERRFGLTSEQLRGLSDSRIS